MRRPSFSRVFVAVAALVLLESSARAEPIGWDYQSWAFPSVVTPDVGPSVPPPTPTTLPNVAAYFQTTGGSTTGSAGIVLADLWGYAYAPDGEQATFNHQPVQIGLGIHDWQSNRSQAVLFNAYLDGTFSDGQFHLTLSYAKQSYSFQLGSSLYQIDLGVPTGYPVLLDSTGATGPVHSLADASVEALVQVHNQPEPSTLVLLGVGSSVAGLLYRRWRRQPRAAA